MYHPLKINALCYQILKMTELTVEELVAKNDGEKGLKSEFAFTLPIHESELLLKHRLLGALKRTCRRYG